MTFQNEKRPHFFALFLLFKGLFPHVEVAVHVEADDAEVVRAGHVGDEALAAFPLLRHSHPHIPIPELQRRQTQLENSCGEEPEPLCCSQSEDANPLAVAILVILSQREETANLASWGMST